MSKGKDKKAQGDWEYVSLCVSCRLLDGGRRHISVCMRDGCECREYEGKVKEMRKRLGIEKEVPK